LSFTVAVIDAAGERSFDAAELPLAIGAPGKEGVVLPAAGSAGPVAFLGFSAGRFFLQPGPDAGAASVDGRPLTESIWIDASLLLVARGSAVQFEPEDGAMRVVTQPDPADQATVPPIVEAAPAAPAVASDGSDDEAIAPAAYQGPTAGGAKRKRRFPVVALVVWSGAAILAAAAWFMFTARSVEVLVSPAPEAVSVEGSLVVRFGPRYLLRPGDYEVHADLAGYEPLRQTVTVTDDRAQTFQIAMERLGDRLFLETPGVGVATVSIDGESVGETPIADQPVRPGRHRVEVAADRYVVETRDIDAVGGGNEIRLSVDLTPDWSVVTLTSEPPGATLMSDGEELAVTPAEVELRSGTHELTLRLAGYKDWGQRLEVEPNTPLELPPVTLQPADGRLRAESVPSGATVLVNGQFRGRTPLTLSLGPSRTFKVEVSEAGYRTAERSVRLRSGETRSERFELEEITGVVLLEVSPPDAMLSVDGNPDAPVPTHLQLIAKPHTLRFSKEGYVAQTTSVTPAEGLAQRVQIRLMTLAEAELAKHPPRIRTANGSELILVPGGRFTMGTERRDVGRRANEGLREVELSNPFYIGVREVTNKEFKEFRAGFRGGTALGYGLELDENPVVRVSWQDAAAFCNWLSAKDSLPPAYRTEEARLVAIWPPTTGYRLPTEAEWVWAMRYAARSGAPSRYPWGNAMPPPAGAGNYGDESARAGLRDVITGYRDDYPVTSPTGKFGPNPLGIYDGGGNVAEWMQDLYRTYTGTEQGLTIDPKGAEEGRYYVIRGSSYRHGSITELRWAYRDFGDEVRPDLGFRLARSIN
jgi:formylglycine-generating enzyme required for sulfatase activity